jgi:predicted nucleic acid-binding protein
LVVKWIDRDLHNEAMAELARTRRRAVSLVDQVSFLVMREGGVQEALAFDQDFVRAGFRLVR